jgi:hypothetical protein
MSKSYSFYLYNLCNFRKDLKRWRYIIKMSTEELIVSEMKEEDDDLQLSEDDHVSKDNVSEDTVLEWREEVEPVLEINKSNDVIDKINSTLDKMSTDLHEGETYLKEKMMMYSDWKEEEMKEQDPVSEPKEEEEMKEQQPVSEPKEEEEMKEQQPVSEPKEEEEEMKDTERVIKSDIDILVQHNDSDSKDEAPFVDVVSDIGEADDNHPPKSKTFSFLKFCNWMARF